MSEEYHDRTEQPTRRRRAEAREEGRVAHSRDLQAGLFVLAFSGVIALAGEELFSSPAEVLRNSFAEIDANETEFTTHTVRSRLAGSMMHVFESLWPFWLALPLAAATGTVLQRGWIFRPQLVVPDAGRLNPARGLARLLSFESLGRIGTVAIKIGLLGGIAWWWVGDWSLLADLSVPVQSAEALSAVEPSRSIALVGAHATSLVDLSARVMFSLGAGLVVWGGIDFLLQRSKHERSLMMTPQEVKDEHDGQQTDPAVRRQLDIARNSLGGGFPLRIARANLILADTTATGPRAIAIEFHPDTDQLPRVVAMGTNQSAARMQQLAAAQAIAVVERPELIRSVWSDASAGRPIPSETHPGLAELLAQVIRRDFE